MLRKLTNVEVLGVRSPKMKIPDGPDTIGFCVTDVNEFLRIRRQFQPDIVIHAAGVCDLDVCEERPLWAHSLNTTGAQVIADIFGYDSFIIYLSSDLVFSGNNTPEAGYNENCEPDPVSVAGKTIAQAEMQIARSNRWSIFRLGLPIGRSITGDKGAVDFIDSRLRRSLPLTLFYDEFRSCIHCEEICNVIEKTISMQFEGIYNLGGPVPFSLHEIGEWVLRRGKYDKALLKGISRYEEKNGPPRIGNVRLDSKKIESMLNYRISAPIKL